ncbi:uncharacterized protein LOC142222103 [Haematobia irritans]|uniref:uncharacterized protein LOC142222103 n=1 Tax=Haematobia irritans TaxID=7368 RepID=UPI003F4F501C
MEKTFVDYEVDDDVGSLLMQWNLYHLHKHFIDHRITTEVLKLMHTSHIRILFTGLAVGDMVIFEDRLKKWKSHCMAQGKMLPSPQETQNMSSSDDCESLVKAAIPSVKTMLMNTQNGRRILKYYEENKILHEDQRNLLIDTIAKYMEAEGYSCTISDCTRIENQICSLFPTESMEYYTSGKRGKIYNKIYNLRRISKSVLKEKRGKGQQKLSIDVVPDSEALKACEMIKNQDIPSDEFDIYWKKCAQIRFSQFENLKSTEEILKAWPDYLKPCGLDLIATDFDIKFPNAADLICTWSMFKEKIIYTLKVKIASASIIKILDELETIDEESQIFCVFWYLHNLFPPQLTVITDVDGEKRKKKFSILDSQNSFALIAKTHDEVEHKLKILKSKKTKLQPLLIVYGDVHKIDKIYIYLDGIRYPSLKVLTALNLLYKIYFVFNIEFPKESEIYFNFIQSFFFDMKLEKNIPKVISIKDEILNVQIK